MAGNHGKFIDRSPIICPAGLSIGDHNDNVASTLKHQRVVDEIDALKHDAKIWKEDEFVVPKQLPNFKNPNFKGTNTEIKEVLCPPVLTRYQQLVTDLKDTCYDSYWNADVGKSRDPNQGLPAGMNIVGTTFGTPSVRDISVKELVNPSKGPYQVLAESQVAHDMYKKTHRDYNPSEKIDRGYYRPAYDPKRCYGAKTKYDPRGIWAKCALDWYEKRPVVHAAKVQADYLDRTRPILGKVLAPNKNIECVPKGYSFGTNKFQERFGMEELLKDAGVSPSIYKKDVYRWVSSLNKLRLQLKEKCRRGYNLNDLFQKALYIDKEKTDWINTSDFFDLCTCSRIKFSTQDLMELCEHLKYIHNEKINYRKFIEMIDINRDFPSDFKITNDLPDKNKYYITSSQAASCDYLFINNEVLPPAGIPSIRNDLPRPIVPEGGCRADLDNLGEETSAKAVVNPSIYTNYGLNYRDFFMPRSAETIRNLFEKIGYTFPGNSFEELWKMGLDMDCTGMVCIDTFKKLLQRQCAKPKLLVDEKDIECARLKI
ncbi:EF-hand domain-containing family member B-like [Sitophilus oryzae]|uniref:EF-hand domain-containing family member B-like n=1 Tax=Sitophilus oryzae TaxID=7048 RepID=A0A6J2X9L0_SITOR|nr:EF-hand domain-containing family member B-like [Sitophilus oryzae]